MAQIDNKRLKRLTFLFLLKMYTKEGNEYNSSKFSKQFINNQLIGKDDNEKKISIMN